jgi:hypothetical protein
MLPDIYAPVFSKIFVTDATQFRLRMNNLGIIVILIYFFSSNLYAQKIELFQDIAELRIMN